MQAFLINIARRPDRLRAMQRQLSAADIPFVRIEAVDAKATADETVDPAFTRSGPLGVLPKGDKCCSLSHVRAWKAFLETGAPYGLILEDDIVLDPAAAGMLRESDWIPPHVGLLKLERFGPERQRVLIGDPMGIAEGHSIARLHSRHTGAGAYIVSRATAAMLAGLPQKWTLPVDHMLFNPNNSPVALRLRPYQMMPAIARQSAGKSDIEEWRVAARKLSWQRLRRKFVRAYYELHIVPGQIASLIQREATLVRM